MHENQHPQGDLQKSGLFEKSMESKLCASIHKHRQ